MRSRLASRFAALGVLVLVAGGCSPDPIRSTFIANMPPEVRLTQAPVSTAGQYFYAYRMNWVGYDPDGRVDYFLIAVDPPYPDVVDTTWSRTAKNEEIVFFKATRPDTVGRILAEDYHTFAVAAVDEKGAISTPVWRTFNSYTIAPEVQILSPTPNRFLTAVVTPSVRIRWTGQDRDGQFTTKPIKYKFKLFRPRDPDFPGVNDPVSRILSEPRLLRWKYAPTFGPSESCPSCSYWDSTPADTTDVQYTNLVPNNIYAFAVTGLDEAGAYDPIFSRSKNLLKFAVTFAGTNGPVICMFNEFFNFCYAGGGYSVDPTRYFNVEAPAGQLLTFNWFATAPQGAEIERYRWVMDLEDLTDETERTDEGTDWVHWSSYSLQTTSATIGPFPRERNGDVHLFFIEAEDNNKLRSLGIIRFTVVSATLENDLLFVDDTRLGVDATGLGGQIDPPRGPWPNAAELDTFFFAKGGYPWKGYPPGTQSQPGIFNGFTYDTIGTRRLAGGLVPLARLGLYRTVVWFTDDIGSGYTGDPSDLLSPTTSLRFMSSPGHPSTISTYLKQGGRVWLFGGGAGYATLAAWNKRNTAADEFTFTDGELRPGRFMYDFAHWRSALSLRPGGSARLNVPELGPPWENAAPGRNWTQHGLNHDLSMPNYDKLRDPTTGAPVLEARTVATDPPSPLRNPDFFYLLTNYPAEFMGTVASPGANFVRENASTSPGTFREESTLDTLYFVIGGTAPNGRPLMTYYHGFESSQLVFSGFPLWFFQRTQARGLADFVLRDIFQLQRQATAPSGPARSGPAAAAVAPPRHLAAPQRR